MLKLFKSRHPFLYLGLLVYTFVFNGVLYFKDITPTLTEHSFLFQLLNIKLEVLSKPILITISILFVYFIAIFINRTLINFNLTNNPSFLPAFAFITLQGIFPEMIIFSPSVIGLFIMIHIIYKLFTIFDIENAVQQLFFVSAFAGVGTLIYSPIAIFLLLLFIAIPILKRPNWWEIAILPFGFIIPIYLVGFAYYLGNDLTGMLDIFMNSFPQWAIIFPEKIFPYVIPIIYIAILAIFAFLIYTVSGSTKLVRENRYQRVLSAFFSVALILFLFSSAPRINLGLYILTPVAMLIARMYADGNKKILDISYLILILINIFVQWQLF